MNGEDLKNSILQMAMQGKLVEQRSEEGTGEDLYQQIKEEKQKLIAEGKLKKEKPLPEINEEEIPFEIPKSWKWVKFGNCVNFYMGKTPPRAETKWWNGKFPWVSIADMPENGHIKNAKECVSTMAINDIFKDRISPKGTLLMSFKLTVGRVSILDVDAVHNEAIISINTHQDKSWFIKNYLFYILPKITNYGDSRDAIKGKTLNKTSINNLLFPLPPYNEIGRIVCRLKEVLPFVEEYGKLEREREDLDVELPEKLKKSILQYAMQGKLVQQIPSEGTAEELYAQIQEEKQKLISEGKLKKEKPLASITEDEMPFQIPPTWKWVRLGEIATIKGGKRIPAGRKLQSTNNGHIYIRVTNMKNGTIENSNILFCPNDIHEKIQQYIITKDDVYITVAGSIGDVGLVPSEFDNANLTENADRIIVYDNIKEFIFYLLLSWIVQKQIKLATTKVGQPKLAIKRIQNLIIPLPPIKEQRRISKQIDKVVKEIS